MKEVQLYLVPQPGSKPEFLATVVPVDPSPAVNRVWQDLLAASTSSAAPAGGSSNRVVLEGYTRDGWAWKPSSSTSSSSSSSGGRQAFVNVRVQSTDGRQKLKGFVKYLADRQKCAYGRFAMGSGSSGGNKGKKGGGVWVVSYIQSNAKETERMDCRIALDLTAIEECPLKPLVVAAAKQQQQQQQPNKFGTQQSSNGSRTKPQQPIRRKGGGLLGQLVGAQQQTNRHMEATSNKARAGPSSSTAASGGGGDAPRGSAASTGGGANASANAAAPSALRTAAQVLSEFRQSMQDKMLDFELAESEESLKVSLSVAEHTAGLSTEDKQKVTMEVLKYMVLEAAEETNEEWIAYKEPSEFMDEVEFTIYKEGAAPPDVLEEINQGELPEEVRAEQRALTVERQRQVQQAESRDRRRVQDEAHRAKKEQSSAAAANGAGDDFEDDDDDLEALNTVKRDRRTIADYDREKRQEQQQQQNTSNKRSRES